ncbi:thiamine-phosphate kinase [Botrimarina colliarenosi]|nr:thiamine-phosphate kinase [Botrimarina colliarenosi]
MELDFVEWLRQRMPKSSQVRIGIGDDAALLTLSRPELVATADLLIDGVHFLTAEHPPEAIGYKALAVNLSDLAAMAAKPAGALVSLALPRDGAGGLTPSELAKRLFDGMLPLAEEFGSPIVGGDTNVHAGPLVVSVTALGEPTGRGVVRRDGARPGDVLLVTGELGGSLAGKHLGFTPRVTEALTLHQTVELQAMMDLSDGLSLDLARLCKASGVGAVVEAAAVPISAAASALAMTTGDLPLKHALSDGEDFELLLSVSPDDADRLLSDTPPGCRLIAIGKVVASEGVTLRQPDGTMEPLLTSGYEHR